ncbi:MULTISPECIES: ROK family protein [Sphingomonas]|uniref:ROK family protein n=1 Tax=Sphingomonas TaxID=13687 RepID=UPI001F074E2B|nr:MULTISPECIES: ROK family protein [Sphingomonas]
MSGADALLAGVELGGTKGVCTLADARGTVVEQQRVETRDPAATLGELRGILERWRGRYDALGIASFGPIDLDPNSRGYGRILPTPKPGWSGADLLDGLSDGAVPVALDTDVNAAAFAEGRWGRAQGLTSFAYITVGTGIGVGVVDHGRSIGGLGHGEAGHLRGPRLAGDEWPGACPFHGDCAEGLAAGPAIRAAHGPGTIADDWPGWDRVEQALAMLLHNLFLTLQPQRILIGGGVSEGRPWLLPRVRARLLDSLAGYHVSPALAADEGYVSAPGLGDQAGPLASIALALQARSA